jgi:putative redox protein
MSSKVIVRSVPGERYTQEVQIGKHRFLADEPVSLGGADKGPGPYRFLLTALGA